MGATNGSPCLPFSISVSPHSGRSYHATRKLSAGTCVLDVATPYTCTLYKRFRNEVCAECWKYDGGRRHFLTCREYGEEAGLSFCDEHCRDAWLEREGHELIELLKTLEAVRRRTKGKAKATDPKVPVELTKEAIECAWEKIDKQQERPKALRRWHDVQLDDFEADMARYVLVALYHYARELADIAKTPLQQAASSAFGAHWSNFADLQSNEMHLVAKFPELLENHIKIFQVLRSRFNPVNGASPVLLRLADVVTTPNVRIALGVDPGNSFGIWEAPVTEESEGLGFGIYPIPSFFNHREWPQLNLYYAITNEACPDCTPNVRKDRDGRRMRFITTRDVDAGDELCISYGHVEDMTWQQRQQELKEGWFFECRCSRCEAEKEAQN
ncbi:hypothetical protein NM688_g6308 [Phlebia brevispora]|uniref:Uncharacterized protein n=1 Tax=Phlebia brevispora TaxID=194682 RepID=A0ACC1SHF4_9APHY|nr:hypothetical protein NM688_g6308 [Phlebia brevispora]